MFERNTRVGNSLSMISIGAILAFDWLIDVPDAILGCAGTATAAQNLILHIICPPGAATPRMIDRLHIHRHVPSLA